MEDVSHILSIAALVVGYISTIAAFIIAINKSYKKTKLAMDSIKTANLCLLRSRITTIYYTHADEEDPQLREYERKNLDELYSGYVALGGNTFVKDIYEIMRHWKVSS